MRQLLASEYSVALGELPTPLVQMRQLFASEYLIAVGFFERGDRVACADSLFRCQSGRTFISIAV
jgi:hypothetical protein